MNRQQMALHLACLGMVALLLAGCGGLQVEPTATPTPLNAVNADYYRFQLGDFECVCLNDGHYDYSPRSKFVGASLRRSRKPFANTTCPRTASGRPIPFCTLTQASTGCL